MLESDKGVRKMKRLYCNHEFRYYTQLKQVLLDLGLADQDYLWLISDFEAYPMKKEYQELLNNSTYLLLSTKELMNMLEADDFQWIWAVFSAIPSHHQKDDIVKQGLPYVDHFEKGQYNPHTDPPKLQHPYADFELYAVDSTCLFMITENDSLISRFKKSYPKYMEE